MYLFFVFFNRLPCLSSYVQYILRLWDVPISSFLRTLRICVQNIKILQGFLSGHEMGRGSDCHLVTRPDVARVPPFLGFFRHFSATNTHALPSKKNIQNLDENPGLKPSIFLGEFWLMFHACTYTEPKIRNIYSQKWNCAASFSISTFM